MRFLYIALTIAFTVASQLLIKRGVATMGAVGDHPTVGDVLVFVFRAFSNWSVAGGLLSAGLAAAAWVLAVSKNDLSFAYPFTGVSIVAVMVLGSLLFKEEVPWNRWAGLAVVCLGIWIASRK